MKHFSFGGSTDQVLLYISESRWWWDIPVHVADGICALSRHRLCNSLVVWAYELSDRHLRAHLAIPVDREHWVEWAKLTGAEDPSWWWEDENPDTFVGTDAAAAKLKELRSRPGMAEQVAKIRAEMATADKVHAAEED